MSANGTNGVNGHGRGGGEALQWKMGLVNNQGKFLTAETFGFKINASGQSLRKKQMWTIEHDPNDDEAVYVRSHLGRYLAGDKKGNVTCSSEERGPDEKFSIAYHPDGSGRWALQNKAHTYFFGGSEDNLRCYEKAPTNSEWWIPYLAVHPQVNLRSVHRKKYAHLADDEIHVDERIPWGVDALITLEYKDGKYALRTCNNLYATRQGSLVNSIGKDSCFTLELRSGQFSGMAFKDCAGAYLTAVGQTGLLVAREKAAKQDIVFTLEDSHPQVFITAHNGKKVSIKQGQDVSANQIVDEIEDTETFQVEFDKATSQWRFRSHLEEKEYWSLEAAAGIQAVRKNKGDNSCRRPSLAAGLQESQPKSLFSIEWLDDGKVAFKSNGNNKYLTAKLNGSLNASTDALDDKSKFTITVINRPILVLRCDFGFMGAKTPSSTKIECNKSNYDIFSVEHSTDGSPYYYIKGANGLYWSVSDDCLLNADSSDKVPFRFELHGQSKFAIKTNNDFYLRGEQNGIIIAKQGLDKATLWEY